MSFVPKRFRAVAILGMLLLPRVASAGLIGGGSVSIAANQDTWIEEDHPTNSHGTDKELKVTNEFGKRNRALYRFPVTSVSGDTIESALLRLYVTKEDSNAQKIRLYRVTMNWTEVGGNWANVGTAIDTTRIYGEFVPSTTGTVTIDITNLVQGWADGTWTNYGLMLVSDESDDESRYASREETNTARQPRLDVKTRGLGLNLIDLGVTKVVDDPSPSEGDSVQFTIIVRNSGLDVATSIHMLDLLPDGLTYSNHTTTRGTYTPSSGSWLIGSIASGGSATLGIAAVVDSGTTGMTIANTASVVSVEQTDLNGANNTATATILVEASDLVITMAVSDSLPTELDPVVYTVTARNGGPSPATGVVVRDLLPAGISYVSSTPSAGTYASGTGLWTIATIPSGGAPTLQLRGVVDAGTVGQSITNTASVLAVDQLDPNPGNEADSATVFVAGADLAVAKTVNNSTPAVGATIRYTVKVSNSGPSDAGSVELTDSLPAGVTYSFHTPTQGTYTPGTGVWNVGAIAAGDTASLEILATVDSGTAGQTITNVATITNSDLTDANSANDSDSVDIVVDLIAVLFFADLQVTKAVDLATPYEGDTIHFTVTVENLGPDDTNGVVIRDALPAGITFVSATPSAGTYASGSGNWNLGVLSAGFVETLDLEATVNAGTAGNTITNSAFVNSSSAIDLVAGNNADQAVVVPTLVPGIELRSVSGPATVTKHQTGVRWLVDVENVGFDPVNVDSVALNFTRGTPGDLDTAFAVTPVGSNVAAIPGQTIVTLAFDVDLLPAATAGPVTIGARISVTDTGPGGALTDAAPDSPLAVVIQTPAMLSAVPGTLMPVAVFGGLADARFHLDVTNAGEAIPLLDGASQLYLLAPGDTLKVPLESAEGTRAAPLSLTFGPITIPPGYAAGLHPVSLDLVGIDSNGATYAEIVPVPDSVTVAENGVLLSALQTGATLQPGQAPVSLYRLSITSMLDHPVSLDALTLRDATAGPGSTVELDGNFNALSLYLDNGDGAWNSNTDSLVGTTSIASGAATFASAIAIPDSATTVVHVVGAPSLVARDGDVLDLVVEASTDLVFSEGVTHFSAFPIDPAGGFPVNGMSAAQIPARELPEISAFRGDTAVLVCDFQLPSNGYTADVLNDLRFVNQGSALNGIDLQQIHLWSDGGNDAFDAGVFDDVDLGVATWTGTQWRWTPLAAPLPKYARRFFVSTDITPTAVLTRTIRFAIPLAGVVVASTNDGPVDVASASPTTITIREPISPMQVLLDPQSGESLRPGTNGRLVFSMGIVNTAAVAETLTTLSFTNTATGLGTQAQLDADWRPLRLSTSTRLDDLSGDLGRVDLSFASGRVTFGGLNVVIIPGDTARVVVTTGASLVARDGDVLDLEISAEDDVVFRREVQFIGSGFPLAPTGSFPVDGMSAAQVSILGSVPPTVLTGSVDNLALKFRIPANGYQTDVLRLLSAVSDTTNPDAARPVTDIARVKAWHDDGDGVFEPSQDTLLGEMLHTGSVWQRSGLSLPLSLAGEVVFLSCDIAPGADLGSRILFGLPTLPIPAFNVDTGNDGPVDAAKWSATSQTISAADRISFTSNVIDPGPVAPGATDVPLLHFVATNLYDVPKTLTGLRVTNQTSGSGTTAQRDNETVQVYLRRDSNDGAGTIATGSFAAGTATFSGLSLVLAPGAGIELFVAADVALLPAKDGDVVGAEIAAVTDVTFADAEALLVDNFPIDSGAAHAIDGMVAGQILNNFAPGATIGPGEGPVLALDVVIPSNGYSSDVLEGLKVVNESSADSAAIANMRLWLDGGNDAFDAGSGDDIALGGPLSYLSGEWVSAALSQAIPVGGARVFVSVTSSPSLNDSSRVRLAIPVDGVTVASSNDGPRDASVVNTEDILFSTAALLASIEIVPAQSTVGQTFSVSMTIKNNGVAAIDSIQVASLVATGTGSATLFGPTPEYLSLAPTEQGAFTWTASADGVGTVRLTGSAEGVESGTGFLRQSLDATSNEHVVFYPIDEVGLTPVESMPFSINRGQTNVVPLSLTLENDGVPGSSAVQMLQVAIRLLDEFGGGIPPADLLSHIAVKEGTNTYVDRAVTETDPSGVLNLFFNPIARITAQDEVTLSISIDISDSTTVPNFRLVIADSTAFSARDAVDFSAVPVALSPPATYPIQSGLARIVGEATRIDVAADSSSNPPLSVGQGQNAVTLMTLDLYNPDADSLAADVRVSSFALSLANSAGIAMAQPASILERVRVRAGAQTLANRAISLNDGAAFTVLLSPLLSVAVETPTSITVEADFADLATLGTYSLVLADSSQFDARDANTGASVPAIYATNPVAGSVVTVEAGADSVLARGIPQFPSSTPVGQSDVAALSVILRHPGGAQTAPIRCDSLRVQCRGPSNQPLAPGVFVDRARAMRSGVEVASTTDLPLSGGEFTLVLNGTLLAPGTSDSLQIRVDVEATAPAALFQISLGPTSVYAVDVNLGAPVQVTPESGEQFPFTSGLTQLESPARELAAGFAGSMPAVLVADQSSVAVATLTLRNTAGESANEIRLDRLRVRAADDDFAVVPIGAALERVQAFLGDDLWAESAILDPADLTALLVAADTLLLAPGNPVQIEIRASFREETTATSLRLGLTAPDVGIVQPESALLSVSVAPENGQSFPFWTDIGNFTPRSLAGSYSNFPNPFAAGRAETNFAFYLPQNGRVTLKILSPRGESVISLLEETPLGSGLHQSNRWDGRNGRGQTVVNGVYLAILSVVFEDGTSERIMRKVAVVR